MQSGYYQVTGAMVAQFNRLDVATNNLANVNTSGFKRDSVIIGDFERLYQDRRDILPHKNQTKEAAKFFNRTVNRVPMVVDSYIDFTAANMKSTSNPLDFALNGGDLFFAVDTKNGVRLTQQSSFVVDSEGFLATKDGNRVLPDTFREFDDIDNRGIKLPNRGDLELSKSGDIYVDGERVAKLFIAKAKNLKMLDKEGDSLYKVKNIEDNIVSMGDGNFVRQGFKQISNVNAVKEMVNLIEINRVVEIYQKVMTTHMDELNKEAVTKLASVRA